MRVEIAAAGGGKPGMELGRGELSLRAQQSALGPGGRSARRGLPRDTPILGEVDVDDFLARGVHAGVGASRRDHPDGLCHRRHSTRVRSNPRTEGCGRLQLKAVIGTAVIFDQQAIAGHQGQFRFPAGRAKPRRNTSRVPSAFGPRAAPAICELRPNRRRSAGRRPARGPGAFSDSTRESKTLTRTGPLSDGAMNQAPGKGDRPRIRRSTSSADRRPFDPRLGGTDLLGVGDPLSAGCGVSVRSPRSIPARAWAIGPRRSGPAARTGCRLSPARRSARFRPAGSVPHPGPRSSASPGHRSCDRPP